MAKGQTLGEYFEQCKANPPKSDEPEASDYVDAAIWHHGRNAAPAELYKEGWSPTCLGDILSLFSAAEWPMRVLPRSIWLEWFRAVTAPVVAEPLEVWRAQYGRRIGLSWSTSRDVAQWFHRRNGDVFRRPDARLLHGFAPPEAVLWTGHNGRGEQETVVDPTVRKFWKVVHE